MVMKVVISGHENGHEMSDNLMAKICIYFYPTLSNLIQLFITHQNLFKTFFETTSFLILPQGYMLEGDTFGKEKIR